MINYRKNPKLLGRDVRAYLHIQKLSPEERNSLHNEALIEITASLKLLSGVEALEAVHQTSNISGPGRDFGESRPVDIDEYT